MGANAGPWSVVRGPWSVVRGPLARIPHPGGDPIDGDHERAPGAGRPSRTRRSSSTCTRLIGSTYGLRTSIERRITGFDSSSSPCPVTSTPRSRAPAARADLADRLQLRRHEPAVVLGGDAAVGLREHHLDQVDRRLEVRPLAIHRRQLSRFAARERAVERVLDAEPRAEHQPRLRPGELPRDRAQARTRSMPPPAPRGTAADVQSPISASGVDAWK